MIARSVTIFAPIVNEWQAPLPILIMLVFSCIGMLTSFTFPDQQPLDAKAKQSFQPLAQNEEQSNITFHDVSKEFNISISNKSTKSDS